jgi:hypothetical protein
MLVDVLLYIHIKLLNIYQTTYQVVVYYINQLLSRMEVELSFLHESLFWIVLTLFLMLILFIVLKIMNSNFIKQTIINKMFVNQRFSKTYWLFGICKFFFTNSYCYFF